MSGVAEERKPYLDLIAKNISVCSSRTIEEVIESFSKEEANYIKEKLADIAKEPLSKHLST